MKTVMLPYSLIKKIMMALALLGGLSAVSSSMASVSPGASIPGPVGGGALEGTFLLAVTAETVPAPPSVPAKPEAQAPKPAEKKKKEKKAAPARPKVKRTKKKTATAPGDKGKAKEEEEKKPGFLTRTLKKLVGEDEESKSQESQKPGAAQASGTGDKAQAQPAGEKEDSLKSTFKKLIGIGASEEKKAEEQAKAQSRPQSGKTAKQEESEGLGSTLKNILGGDEDKEKKSPAKTEEPQQKEVVKAKPAPVKSTAGKSRTLAKKELGAEEEELEEGRKIKKGQNVLKNSFKELVKDKEGEEEE